MGGGRRPDVDTSKLYEILGVDQRADSGTIKKAFRKLAMKNHPDKGGDPAKFQEIQKAYEILGDEEKRELYDKYGLEGVEQGGRGGGASDLFDLFGGLGGRGRRQNRQQRGENMVHPLKVKLADLYGGTTKKLKVTRKVLCPACEGRGGEKGSTSSCSDCNGQGVRVQIRQIGPGMIQQMQMPCETCGGEGEVLPERYKCKKCRGKKVLSKSEQVTVEVEPGMQHNQKITFSGMSDEAPNTITGDLVLVLQLKDAEEQPFKRDGMDLILDFKVSLVEALCGYERYIQHLDGRVLKITSTPGEIIKPGDLRVVEGEGMPKHRNPFVKGNLYLKYDIKFPESGSLSVEALQTLNNILPVDHTPMDVDTDSTAEAEEVILKSFDVDMERARRLQQQQDKRKAQYDSDDEHHHGPEVGCRSQ